MITICHDIREIHEIEFTFRKLFRVIPPQKLSDPETRLQDGPSTTLTY